MRTEKLNILYTYNSPEGGIGDGHYEIREISGRQSLIDLVWLEKFCAELAHERSDFKDCKTGRFSTLELLKGFAVEMAFELGAETVFILSITEYNQAVTSVHDLDSFKDIFSRYGEKISFNPASRSKGLIGRIFHK